MFKMMSLIATWMLPVAHKESHSFYQVKLSTAPRLVEFVWPLYRDMSAKNGKSNPIMCVYNCNNMHFKKMRVVFEP